VCFVSFNSITEPELEELMNKDTVDVFQPRRAALRRKTPRGGMTERYTFSSERQSFSPDRSNSISESEASSPTVEQSSIGGVVGLVRSWARRKSEILGRGSFDSRFSDVTRESSSK
jgi:hypothetical protein